MRRLVQGAHERKAGYFELADGVRSPRRDHGDDPGPLQVKYRGSSRTASSAVSAARTSSRWTVRIVAATNRDAAKAVRDKAFRETSTTDQRAGHLPAAASAPRRRHPLLVEAFITEFNGEVRPAGQGRGRGRDAAASRSRVAVEREGASQRDGAGGGRLRRGVRYALPSPARWLPRRGRAGRLRADASGTTLEQGERELILRTLESVTTHKTRAAAILGTTRRPSTTRPGAGGWTGERASDS